MHKTRLRHFLNILEVPLRAILPENLPILNKDEETEDLQNAGRSSNDEAVLIPVRKARVNQSGIDMQGVCFDAHPRFFTQGVTPYPMAKDMVFLTKMTVTIASPPSSR